MLLQCLNLLRGEKKSVKRLWLSAGAPDLSSKCCFFLIFHLFSFYQVGFILFLLLLFF